MKTIPILRGGLLSVAAAAVSMSLAGPARTLSLEEGFRSPPDSAKPQVYYFMMNGNITKEGLTCDFEAMAKAGLGGMIMMDAGCYMPAGPCTFNSPAWFDMLRHAHREAKRLGLTICLPNCSGWSSSGGPWNPPANGMKWTVHTETAVQGPRRFSGVLPRTKKDNGFYEDIAVLAYPTPEKGAALADFNFKRGRDRRHASGSGATEAFRPEQMVARERIVDLTDRMASDGKLEWDVPSGNWTILRLGFVCNGRTNHPSSRGGRGLEVDKLSVKAMDFHFNAYVTRLCDLLGIGPDTDNTYGINNIEVDSYEVGCQDWTQGLEKTFETRLGYSIRPYLPVLAGRIVGSVDESERFLEDFRRLLADLFAENYSGRLTELCHKKGLLFSLEPYGNSNADDLQYGQPVDIPMSEFWSAASLGEHRVGSVGNAHQAASIAHVWGRRFAGAEAFTAGPEVGGRWLTTPFSIKSQGDRVYAEGVNRIIFHRYACQPWPGEKYLPAMTMGRWGIHLERTQTWWRHAPAFFRYQSRCQWMLQEGLFVADALYWRGEVAPANGVEAAAVKEGRRSLPGGYGWDFCDTKAVEALKVVDGKVVVPGGVAYEVLVLPGSHSMSERMAQCIARLVAAGAKVVAPGRPSRVPGLRGYPHADARLRDAVAATWRKGVMECTPGEALAHLGIMPDFAANARDVSWIHRRDASADWYFVAQDNETPSTFEASFRISGKAPEIWDPETGEIRPAPVWREQNGRTFVTLDFPPSGSAFVVFRAPPSAKPHPVKVSIDVPPFCPEKREPPKKVHALVIKKAVYGVFKDNAVEGDSVDVTAKIASCVRDGEVNVKTGIELARRDPAFGVHKITRIEYELDGVAQCERLREGAMFCIPKRTIVQPPPDYEWRDGQLVAWRPLTGEVAYSDGSVRRVAASPARAVDVEGAWDVSFPKVWDAPENAVFPSLSCWTQSQDPGIKYFSGTATYRKRLEVERGNPNATGRAADTRIMLDLGDVKNFAEVTVNGKTYPVLWKPPFRLDITDAVKTASVQQQVWTIDLEIKVTNLWPNRLIGDDFLPEDCEWQGTVRRGVREIGIKEIPQWVKDGRKSPTGRHTFTTWRHWRKGDALLPSGLIGPVRLWFGEPAALNDVKMTGER